jgi:hypothetical protein
MAEAVGGGTEESERSAGDIGWGMGALVARH